VREAVRIQTSQTIIFFDERITSQFIQVGNVVHPLLASKVFNV